MLAILNFQVRIYELVLFFSGRAIFKSAVMIFVNKLFSHLYLTYLFLYFIGAYEYYYHRNKQHSNPLYCDICSGEFKSKEKLRVHKINKHLNDNEKPYVCSICGKGMYFNETFSYR